MWPVSMNRSTCRKMAGAGAASIAFTGRNPIDSRDARAWASNLLTGHAQVAPPAAGEPQERVVLWCGTATRTPSVPYGRDHDACIGGLLHRSLGCGTYGL